jgi:PAS domain S-box-containing protein/putative nucleotidyltransferase with HDIG domain
MSSPHVRSHRGPPTTPEAAARHLQSVAHDATAPLPPNAPAHSCVEALLEQSIAGVYVLALDGTILYVNEGFAGVGGHAVVDLIGRNFRDYVEPSDALRAAEHFQAAARSRQPPFTVQLRTRSGGLLEVITDAGPVRFQDKPAVLGLAIDVTERRRVEDRLVQSNRALRVLRAGNAALVHARSEEALLGDMCHTLVSEGDFAVASVAIQAADGHIRLVTRAGPGGGTAEMEEQTAVTRGEGGHWSAIRSGTTHAYALGVPRERADHPDVSRVYLPLLHADVPFGSLGIHAASGVPFSQDDLAMFAEFAGDLAYGIVALRNRAERDAFTDRLHRSLEDTIAVLAAAAEMRDPYTAGHQQEVARLAVAIARELGYDEAHARVIRFAALVHDVGKIRVPSEILARPGRLTDVERQLVQTHVQAGYDILKTVDFPWPIATFVLQHHEHLDGSGYPNGAAGDEILPESRILCVADVVEAMSADRPYRSGKGIAAALAEVEEGRGTRYDAAVVDACIQLIRSGAFSFHDDRRP